MLYQGMTDSPTVEWNEPTQARSREKVQRIEQAARALLLDTGSLDLKMTEVAKRAKVPVGTLYQFFPSRTALVQKLFAIEMQRIDTSVSDMLFAVEDLSLFEQQLEQLLRAQTELVRSDPAMMIIWGSVAVDPVVQAADLINTQQNADILAERMGTELGLGVDARAAKATALLICHLWSSVIRLCMSAAPDEEQAIVQQYARMIANHVRSLRV